MTHCIVVRLMLNSEPIEWIAPPNVPIQLPCAAEERGFGTGHTAWREERSLATWSMSARGRLDNQWRMRRLLAHLCNLAARRSVLTPTSPRKGCLTWCLHLSAGWGGRGAQGSGCGGGGPQAAVHGRQQTGWCPLQRGMPSQAACTAAICVYEPRAGDGALTGTIRRRRSHHRPSRCCCGTWSSIT